MGLSDRLRAHPILISLIVGSLLLAVILGAAATYVLGDQRRTGRLLAEFLTRELGLPITIDRVVTDGRERLTLLGIHVPPGAHWGGALSVREMRVEGGVMPFLFPRGRHLSVRLVATTVTLSESAQPIEPPTAALVAQVRETIRRFLEWPGTAAVEISGGELRSGPETIAFDLKGEKNEDGQARITLTFHPRSGDSLAVRVGSQTVADGVVLALELDGGAAPLHPFWPSALPRPERLNAQATLSIPTAPNVEARGEFTLAPDGRAAPVRGRLLARYRPAERRLDLTELTLSWEPRLALQAKGAVEAIGPSARLTFDLSGQVGENRLEAHVEGDAEARQLRVSAKAVPFVLEPWVSLLELTRTASEYSLRADRGEVSVVTTLLQDWSVDRLRVNARLETATLGLKSRPGESVKIPAVTMEGSASAPAPDGRRVVEAAVRAPKMEIAAMGVSTTVGFSGEGRVALRGLSPELIERGALSIANQKGEIFARLTARPASTPGSLALALSLPRLDQLPPLFSGWRPALKGSASAEGLFAFGDGKTPSFKGELHLDLPRGEIESPKVSLVNLSLRLPLRYGVKEEPPWGSVEIGRMEVANLVVDRLKSPARFEGGQLVLPTITYSHYGGAAEGWLEADLSLGGASARLRLEGRGIDLGQVVEGYRMAGTKVTGKANYLVAARRDENGRMEAGARLAVPEPGGVVSVDLLKGLLKYADQDPTGILRQTLEGLSEFPYKFLTGEARTRGQDMLLSLSLTGRERFGIFPPRVRAINIQNLPLSFLMKVASTPTEPRR